MCSSVTWWRRCCSLRRSWEATIPTQQSCLVCFTSSSRMQSFRSGSLWRRRVSLVWSLLQITPVPRYSWSHLLFCYFNIKWAELCLNELHLLHQSSQWKVTALLSTRVAPYKWVTEEETFLHPSPLWQLRTPELVGQYANLTVKLLSLHPDAVWTVCLFAAVKTQTAVNYSQTWRTWSNTETDETLMLRRRNDGHAGWSF